MGCTICKATSTKAPALNHDELENQRTFRPSPDKLILLETPITSEEDIKVVTPIKPVFPSKAEAVLRKTHLQDSQAESERQIESTEERGQIISPQQSLATRIKKSEDIETTFDISTHVLGTGISGAVRVARHRQTNVKYAIKTLSLEGVNAKKAAMLHNEVYIYLQLEHPNISRLIEVFESDKAIHLVMELCTGGELYDRLASKKKYNEHDAAVVTQQMLSAIDYCHKHLICHRDLKLENWVYADSSDEAPLKLIDFGFSRIFNPGIPMTAMHGTVYYVSPEVMDGCYREKCDIWSIGVIVYMLLSGSPPFNGSFDHEILLRIKRGAFSFAGPRWEGISDQAKSFIKFLLQKDPDQRPSASEALKHPWLLQKENVDNKNIDLTAMETKPVFRAEPASPSTQGHRLY